MFGVEMSLFIVPCVSPRLAEKKVVKITPPTSASEVRMFYILDSLLLHMPAACSDI